MFGAVEGFVGAVDEAFGLNAHSGGDGADAEAGGDVDGYAGARVFTGDGHRSVLYGAAEGFAFAAGEIEIAAGEDDEEFFASVAAEGIIGAYGVGHAFGGGAEDGVACDVAVGIVHVLEVVEVGESDTEGAVFPLAADEFAFEDLERGVAVPDAGEGVAGSLDFEFFFDSEEFGFEFDDAKSGAETDLQFVVVGRFDEVVVGAGLHAVDEIFALGARGEHDDVGIVFAVELADLLADFGAAEAGHHPVEDGDAGGVFFLEDAPGVAAGSGGNDVVSPSLQDGFEGAARDYVVVGDENFHEACLISPECVFQGRMHECGERNIGLVSSHNLLIGWRHESSKCK